MNRLTVLLQCGICVMRRIADLHPGEAKTDARDAAIIATAARSMPHALRSIQLGDQQVAELTMLCGFDDDLAGQITATSNRIRGLLTRPSSGFSGLAWTTRLSWICCSTIRLRRRWLPQARRGGRPAWSSSPLG